MPTLHQRCLICKACNSIEQHGENNCSVHLTFHADYYMVCFPQTLRPKVDMDFSNSMSNFALSYMVNNYVGRGKL